MRRDRFNPERRITLRRDIVDIIDEQYAEGDSQDVDWIAALSEQHGIPYAEVEDTVIEAWRSLDRWAEASPEITREMRRDARKRRREIRRIDRKYATTHKRK